MLVSRPGSPCAIAEHSLWAYELNISGRSRQSVARSNLDFASIKNKRLYACCGLNGLNGINGSIAVAVSLDHLVRYPWIAKLSWDGEWSRDWSGVSKRGGGVSQCRLLVAAASSKRSGAGRRVEVRPLQGKTNSGGSGLDRDWHEGSFLQHTK